MDKPLPRIASLVWLLCVGLVVLTNDDQGVRHTVMGCLMYSIVGAAFGLAADRLARALTDRVPTERRVAEGASLRRFRWGTLAVYWGVLCAMSFSMWWITEPGNTDARGDAAWLMFLTFFLVGIALGWRWGQLGRHPMAARPDART